MILQQFFARVRIFSDPGFSHSGFWLFWCGDDSIETVFVIARMIVL